MDLSFRFTDTAKGGFIVQSSRTDGPLSPTSNQLFHKNGSVYSTDSHTSLIIQGAGTMGWDILQQNLLYLLENFASSTPPLVPVDGQLWFNTSLKQLNVFCSKTWIPLASQTDINQQSTQPKPKLLWRTVKWVCGETPYILTDDVESPEGSLCFLNSCLFDVDISITDKKLTLNTENVPNGTIITVKIPKCV